MSSQERLARRYPDLLIPERMKEGVPHEASYVRSMSPDATVATEEGYAEITRWIEGTPYIRSSARGRQPDLISVLPTRLRTVALLEGSIVEIAQASEPQALGGSVQPQLFPASIKRAEEHVRRRQKWRPDPWQRAVEDLDGYDERPNPLEARCVADFLRALGEYRAWAGDPSLRAMSNRCGGKVSHTTLANALKGGSLPKLRVVQALIEGCGGRDEDIQRWSTAWRQLRKLADGTDEGTDLSGLQLVRVNVG